MWPCPVDEMFNSETNIHPFILYTNSAKAKPLKVRGRRYKYVSTWIGQVLAFSLWQGVLWKPILRWLTSVLFVSLKSSLSQSSHPYLNLYTSLYLVSSHNTNPVQHPPRVIVRAYDRPTPRQCSDFTPFQCVV